MKKLFSSSILIIFFISYPLHGLDNLITAIKKTDIQSVNNILTHNPALANQEYSENKKTTASSLSEIYIKLAQSLNEEHETALFYAIKNGSPDLLKTILDYKPNSNIQLKLSKKSPLHAAAENAHTNAPDLLKLLLDAGADPSLTDAWGKTPLHYAAKNSNEKALELVKLLIEHMEKKHIDTQEKTVAPLAWREDVKDFFKKRSNQKEYPLFEALYTKNLTLAQKIIAKDPQQLIKPKETTTPLIYALRTNNKKIAEFLIKNIATYFSDKKDVLLTSSENIQNLPYYAAEQRQWDIVKLLLQEGATVPLDSDPTTGNTLLHTLLQDINNDTIQALVPLLKPLLNKKNKQGDTPLHVAINNKQPFTIIQLCIEQGANPRIKNNSHFDAPLLVTDTLSPASFKKFFNAYPELINPHTIEYPTPLDLALEENLIQQVEYLYNHGGIYTIAQDKLSEDVKKIIDKPRTDNHIYTALSKNLACIQNVLQITQYT